MSQFSPRIDVPVIGLNLRSPGQGDSTIFAIHIGNIIISNGISGLGVKESLDRIAHAGELSCGGRLYIVRNENGTVDLVCQRCATRVLLGMTPKVAYGHWVRLSAIMSYVTFGPDNISHPAMKASRIIKCSDSLSKSLGASHVIYFSSADKPGFAIAKIIGKKLPQDVCNRHFPGVNVNPEPQIALIEQSI
ncbi:TPA: hypothetical protein DD449_03515 [Candidatus Berkelbacteria bacterium]|uniref:Uncharacterized protein n=1 Tax=Berkelbacteria bacterium GW2011_GWE1_39_12 TaxID=1618337 RepID=A0A0G4B2N3_9BACT|nr:MAG: hypothetical protein UT28_C0001G0335 [Berkelbacteria bacterium GW2011_GWE1_39_12]HBO60726.1 hypothetical protein [Candidatus Berkelbacteria bacterium]